MAFIDLMAFGRGAELANQANWQDVLNDVNVRNSEQQMARAQTTYDLALPGAQLSAEADVLNQMGAASHSAFEAQTVSALANLPAEQQASFLADQIGNRLRTIDPSSPAGAAELKQTENFALMRAQQLQSSGDWAGAQALLRTIPGAGGAQADRVANIMKWSNPASLTTQDITDAGGEMLPNGRVRYGMFGEMDPLQFIQIQRSLADDPSRDLGASGEQLQRITRAREGAADLTARFSQIGVATWTDPNTFAVHPIGPSGAPDTTVNLNSQATPAPIQGQGVSPEIRAAISAAPGALGGLPQQTPTAPAAGAAAPAPQRPAVNTGAGMPGGGAPAPQLRGPVVDSTAAWWANLSPQQQQQMQQMATMSAARINAPAAGVYDPNAIYNGLPPQAQTPGSNWLTGGNR